MNDVVKTELEQRLELERFVDAMTEVKETLSQFENTSFSGFVNAQSLLISNEVARAEQEIAKIGDISETRTTYEDEFRVETVYENGLVSNRNGAAKTYYTEDGDIYQEKFFIDNKPYAADEYLDEIGKDKEELHFKTHLLEAHLKNGKLHNRNGAAFIRKGDTLRRSTAFSYEYQVFKENGKWVHCKGGERANEVYSGRDYISKTYNCLSMNNTDKPTNIRYNKDGSRIETKNRVNFDAEKGDVGVDYDFDEKLLRSRSHRCTFADGYDRKEYFKNGNLKKKSLLRGLAAPHDENGNIMPSEVTYYSNGNVKTEKYQYAQESWRGVHREWVPAYYDSAKIGKPSYVEYYKDGGVKTEKTYSKDYGSAPKLNDIDGKPAVVKYYEDGIVKEETSYDDGVKGYTDKYTKTGEYISPSTPISKSESTSSLSM